jgi:hypothetical protein
VDLTSFEVEMREIRGGLESGCSCASASIPQPSLALWEGDPSIPQDEREGLGMLWVGLKVRGYVGVGARTG